MGYKRDLENLKFVGGLLAKQVRVSPHNVRRSWVRSPDETAQVFSVWSLLVLCICTILLQVLQFFLHSNNNYSTITNNKQTRCYIFTLNTAGCQQQPLGCTNQYIVALIPSLNTSEKHLAFKKINNADHNSQPKEIKIYNYKEFVFFFKKCFKNFVYFCNQNFHVCLHTSKQNI